MSAAPTESFGSSSAMSSSSSLSLEEELEDNEESEEEFEDNKESMTTQELIHYANQVTQRTIQGLESFLSRTDENVANRLFIQDEYKRILVFQDTLIELNNRLTLQQ
jgi:hypothetical protein